MPINFVFEFYTDKRSIDISCFLYDKRSIQNRLYKIYNASFMPINFVLNFIPIKEAFIFSVF